MTAVEWLVDQMRQLKEQKQTLSTFVTLSFYDLEMFAEKAKEMEKEQHQETWETAHQAGRFEGKGIAEENWQTFEPYWEENLKSE